MITTVTLEFVGVIFYQVYSLHVSFPYTSEVSDKLKCSTYCLNHPDCGGIAWDSTSPFLCNLVVDSSTSGASAISVDNAYMFQKYKGGRIVDLNPEASMSYEGGITKCLSEGMKPLPHAQTPKEKAIMSIRQKIFTLVDLKYSMASSELTNSDGQVFPLNDFYWAHGGAANTNTDFCTALKLFPVEYWYMNCGYMRDISDNSFYCLKM